MLDLNEKILVKISILEYICHNFNDDYVTFITHDNSIVDIDTLNVDFEIFENLDTFNNDKDLDFIVDNFITVDNEYLKPYFKLIYSE
jgi:hypothetical protein